MNKESIGYYCWAGPGTVRMLNTKYFNPKIDLESLNRSYEYDYLAEVKEKFGVTDFWATYSWGFSEETEREDYDFILSRLDNFKKNNIRVHAYIQGTNLVRKEFENSDFWAIDRFGNEVPYYKDRMVTCPNNPKFFKFFIDKLNKAVQYNFDGIYIDNIQMGQLTISTKNRPVTFCGCNCDHCKEKFYRIH